MVARISGYLICCVFATAALGATASEVVWPVRLRQNLDRVGQLQWRLRQASNGRCAKTVTDIGAGFDHRGAYASRHWPLLAETLGMAANPVLVGVAPGSPASKAGVASGDTVVSIGSALSAEISATRRVGESEAEVFDRWVEQSPVGKPLNIEVLRGTRTEKLTILPISQCAIKVVFKTDAKIDAYSDGKNVAVTTGLIEFSANDDELALAIAHEFGHAIARHSGKVGLTERRAREDAADAIGIRLVACAGFDPQKAMMLYSRLARRDMLGFLRAPTHRKYSARIELMSQALRASDVCMIS